jgi:hypothetical protein
VVAIVDDQDPQTRKLLDAISAENIEVEVSGSPDRDIDGDAAVRAKWKVVTVLVCGTSRAAKRLTSKQMGFKLRNRRCHRAGLYATRVSAFSDVDPDQCAGAGTRHLWVSKTANGDCCGTASRQVDPSLDAKRMGPR